MEETKSLPAKCYLGRFLELRSDPSTRNIAYEILERETGKTRNSLHVAFHKEGATNRHDSTMKSLTLEIEKALEVVCLVNARQGTPLSGREFLVLASKMAKKEKGKVFSSFFFF